MLHDVGERLLGDAEQRLLGVGLHLPERAGVEPGGDPVRATDHVEVLGQARDQAVALERGRAQLEDQRPQLAEDLLEQRSRAVHVVGLQPEPEPEQRLREGVVELAGEAVALLEHRQLAPGLVQAAVLDEHGGVVGEVAHEPLVVLGEAAVLVGEVEGAHHLAPEHDRHGEEGVEVGMGGRPPAVEAVVAAHVVAAERLGVVERGAQEAVVAGERADGVDLLVGEPGRDPAAEPVALLVGHAQRRVAGAAEAPGRLHQPLEDGVGAQVAGDPEERLAHRGQRRRPISHAPNGTGERGGFGGSPRPRRG